MDHERHHAHAPAMPTPTAARLRRPGWRDPRLVLGIVLVAASVGLGAFVVDHAGRTTPVLVATRELTPGTVLAASDLTTAEIGGAAVADRYATASAAVVGEVVLRTVGQGELVPRASLGDGAALELRPVAVPAGDSVSASVAPGTRVDVWFVPAAPSDGSAPPAPVEVAAALEVAEVDDGDGALGLTRGRSVHVLVPTAALPEVLAALAADGTVSIVPVPGRSS